MDVPPPPPSDHGSAAVPAPGPPTRRVRPLVLVAIGVLVLAGVGAAIAASSGGDPDASPSGSTAASPTTSPSPVPPASPADLKAKPGAFRVFLAWEEVVDGGTEPVSYRITRDGELLTMASAGTSSFVDDDVTPFTTYEYGIVALDADGVESPAATVTTETASAPPGTARVSGFFDVTLRATSHFGLSTISDEPVNQGWRIIPGCDEGLCAAKFSVIGVKEATTTLKHTQSGYQGSFQSNEFVRCGASGANATFTIRFKVTRADVVKGQWRATKIAGTVIQRSPAQLGCVSSGADYDATGTLTQQ